MGGSIASSWKKWREHAMVRNSGWMLLGQAANFILQGASFVLLARLLGVKEYGFFAGAFALVNIVAPYSSLGTRLLFMRYVSADRSKAGVYWGNMLTVTVVGTALLAAIFFLFGPHITHVNQPFLFLLLSISICGFSQVVTAASTVFQTFEKMQWTALLQFLANLGRFLIVLLMLLFLHRATAAQWSIGLLLSSMIAMAMALFWVRREIGPAHLDMELISKRLWEGVGFSFAVTTQTVYNDIDKTMLSHYGLSRENGIYTLAYRIVDIATAPISAMDLAAIPRYFRMSKDGLQPVIRLAKKSSFIAAAIGILLSVAMFFIAPIIPHFVGHDFSDSIQALKWLCWLPVFRGVHQLTGGALTGSGHQSFRNGSQATVACINLLINLWLIPKYGWLGAAWSSLISDGLLAVVNPVLLLWLRSKSARSGTLAAQG